MGKTADPVLSGAPLLYVFYEAASLKVQRALFEKGFRLPVIENQFHPPHEFHGLVKYDGGRVILSLNLSRAIRFRRHASDGLITVLTVPDLRAVAEALRGLGYRPPGGYEEVFTDRYGHHYVFRPPEGGVDGDPDGPLRVEKLSLLVAELDESVPFYTEVLGLPLLDRSAASARFATGTVDLVLEEAAAAPDGRSPRHNSYLVVFYTGAIEDTRDRLVTRGVPRVPRVGGCDIGRTARVIDPDGHILCLYQPSEESLGWASGDKLRSIVSEATGRAVSPVP